ncbi:hypothetical protein GCM10009839_00470 [Catenulispora yoronensis]|uniref:Ricin B lectin domain-containing protein n=1 Tax=Catenulispora yoronensis TaxID=450799 RepID=A0ABP5F0Q6_9ACTN
MSRLKKLIPLAAVIVATPLIVTGTASTASAASTITWKTNGVCLGYALSTFANNVSNLDNVWTEDCSAPGYSSVYWIDSNVTSNIWLEHPDVDTSLCLTAYKDHSVYFEHCKANNNYERWREIHVGSVWHLQNVATGEYLNGGGTYKQVHTSTYAQAWT